MKKKNLTHLAKAGMIAFALLTGAPLLSNALTFSEWIAQYDLPEGQLAPTDNPAGDGINNLLKYALGLDPTLADRDGIPAGEMVNGHLTLNVSKNENATRVEYIVEASSDLINWTAEGLTVTEETASSLIVTDTTATESETRRFLRLRVAVPEGPAIPDAFLYVVGGRTLGPSSAKNWDPELDRADLTTSYHTDPNFGPIDARSILIADVYFDDLTVTNWRRSSSYLPDVHPEDPLGILHWSYLQDAVTYHDGRIYVGPATYNGTENPQSDGSRRVSTDFVIWADVDPETGELGEFSASPRLPVSQTIGATAIVEVNGEHFFYVLGGSQLQTCFYAKIDPVTGAITEWKPTAMGLTMPDYFNAAIGHDGKIYHTTGNLGDGWEVQVATPRQADEGNPVWAFKGDLENYSGGVLWNITRYEDNVMTGRRWDHAVVIGEAEGQKYLYMLGGARTNVAQIDRVDGIALNSDGTLGEIVSVNPLPAVRRRLAAASYQDIVIMPGGSSASSVVNTVDTVFIGRVQPGGNIDWTTASEPMWQYRSFHGAAIVPSAGN